MGKIDELGDAVRRVLGSMADDQGVYRHIRTIEPGVDREDLLGYPLVARATGKKYVPPSGTDVGLLSPVNLIKDASYQPELRGEAIRRLQRGGAGQAGTELMRHGYVVPLYSRPDAEIMPGVTGIRSSRAISGEYGLPEQVLQVAADSDRPLRTLIHEARHATQGDELNRASRALSSISSFRQSGIDGKVVSQASRRYLAHPTEVFTYLGEAGDDFVRANNRLVDTSRDADEVMEMVNSGDALTGLTPLGRQLYYEAYKNNPRARQHMRDVLTRYFAIPGAVAAATNGEQ